MQVEWFLETERLKETRIRLRVDNQHCCHQRLKSIPGLTRSAGTYLSNGIFLSDKLV